jgi:type I restriction enzyme S subunit
MSAKPWPLPGSWHWSMFTDVAHVASDLVDPKNYPNEPHIAPNHIERETGRLLPFTTIAEDEVTSAKHRFSAGQILYSKIRPYLAKVVVVDFDGLCSADMYPIETELDPRFLKWWMLTREFTRQAAGQQARTVLPKINKRALGMLPVPVPPANEQRQIVEILEDLLSRLDAAELGLKLALRRLASYEAVALSLCRDGNESPLSDVTEIQGGIQKQQKRAPKENAYPFLRVANVTKNGLDLDEVHLVELFDGELDRLRLQPGDLLVVEGNGSPSQIGRAALWNGSITDCVHQNHLIRVRPKPGLSAPYLEAVWNSPQNRRQLTDLASSSSGLHTLSVSKLKSLKLPMPTLDRQRELVAEVQDVRDRRRRLDTELDLAASRTHRLRRSLLGAAFSGRLTGRATDLETVKEMADV